MGLGRRIKYDGEGVKVVDERWFEINIVILKKSPLVEQPFVAMTAFCDYLVLFV